MAAPTLARAQKRINACDGPSVDLDWRAVRTRKRFSGRTTGHLGLAPRALSSGALASYATLHGWVRVFVDSPAAGDGPMLWSKGLMPIRS
jgi:hypothetical protein